jgi:hypothetical protein
MIRFLTFIVIALFIVLLTVSRVDGGLIHAPAYSDRLNTGRSPVIEGFAPSSGTSIPPIFSEENSRSNMLGKVMLSSTSMVSGLLGLEDSATMHQGEISKALLAEIVHASAPLGRLALWAESNGLPLSRSGKTDAGPWQVPNIRDTIALTPRASLETSNSRIELPPRAIPNEYASWPGQPPLGMPRDQGPVIAAVDEDTIALAAPPPQNNAPHRLAGDATPRDAMLTPTIIEVVSRMRKDSDNDHSLYGRDENIRKLRQV